jgi:pSer/pThr/pTyr-binding forkhead associated (FHA) protein
MDKPRLILEDGTEYEISGALTTIGRTPDNDVSFTEDSNVSRYHVEIEDRGSGEYWLFDLQSSNGTTLNGEKVTSEKPLSDGDEIVLGGSSTVRFATKPVEEKEEEDKEKEVEDGETSKEDPEPDEGIGQPGNAAAAPQSKKFMYLLVFAAILIGLAVILAVGAIIYYLTSEPPSTDCLASAEIVAPENGDILSEETEVKIDIEDGSCVSEAVFMIGGKEFGRASLEPFEASLDPSKFPAMSDGRDRRKHRIRRLLRQAPEPEIFRGKLIRHRFRSEHHLSTLKTWRGKYYRRSPPQVGEHITQTTSSLFPKSPK